MNSRYIFLILLSIVLQACTPFSNDTTAPIPNSDPVQPAPIDSQKSEFWLEPGDLTVIGQNQSIDLFAVVQKKEDVFPVYIDRTKVNWDSTNPAVASVTTDGVVTGMTEGQAVISARYETYNLQLTITVSGQMIRKSISILGQGSRSYYIYVPQDMPSDARPLLLSLHGGGANGMVHAAMSKLNEVANEQKIYIVYPEGTGLVRTFNGGACCGTAQSFNINDVDYITSVLDQVESLYSIDTSKVYSSGFSNGAIMSHRLACQLAQRFSGIAVVGAGSGQFDFDLNQYYSCNPSRPIPILIIHATNDRNYPLSGGFGGGVSATNFYPVTSTLDDWNKLNNLDETQSYSEIASISTTCYHYKITKDLTKPSAPVTFCKVNPTDLYDSVNEIVYGGGHSWPGGVRSASDKSDIPLQDFNASAYIWKFLNP